MVFVSTHEISMKKITIVLVFCMMFCNVIRAENNLFAWGVTAGCNITKADTKGAGFFHTGWNFDSSGGYFVGLTAKVTAPILGIGVDASFVYQQEMVDIASGDISSTDKLRYFSLPVHLRYDFNIPILANYLSPYLFAGPRCQFALNDFDWYDVYGQTNVSAEGIQALWDECTSLKQTWKLDLGFGLLIARHVQLAYNYAIPLNDTFRLKTAIDEGSSNFKLGTHLITASYFF